MHAQLRQKAVELRLEENLSYSAICQKLKVPKSTLSYWLKEYPLSRERILELKKEGWSKGEASREKFRVTMREKRENKERKIYDTYVKKMDKLPTEAFFVAGLTLYLAEGSKRDYSRIALANTDPGIIKFFINWMVRFLKVDRRKLKAELHLYENMNIRQEEEFWRKEIQFSDKQFFKPQVRKLKKSSFSYKESFRHGTCRIMYGSVDKKTELTVAIKAFINKHF
ncbi:MAG: hypothetical protein A3J46_04755 [Candidatus Yanofskybacteria bacterium RIFCSPHIGHO2_02_FULL_41_11]|uniref:Uncharacterized protein n=1 Tax=Candidatus Yanofskybacteria bacterium RIFCSPHIGHO2_02_FULL_41_11 TaxID=1802675 RepID=A0A1F8FCA7_9BACT|nr:MAG: hypothetical protein A3J46_04755 [Candidatus Yanofskybacteria bacterium RIFCSPHIGHO2_02_FULL_41_11]